MLIATQELLTINSNKSYVHCCTDISVVINFPDTGYNGSVNYSIRDDEKVICVMELTASLGSRTVGNMGI
jgi:hypothetical protein